MKKTSPALTAAICTYDRYLYLDQAIQSLLDQESISEQFEIVVIDNTPNGLARAKSAEKYAGNEKVNYITVDRPGLANARNVAVQAAKGRLVAFLDDDAVAEPNWVDAYIEAFEQFGDKAKVAGGPISLVFEGPRPSWLHDDLLIYFTKIDWGQSARLLDKHQWVAGANIVFDRESYIEAGGCETRLGRVGNSASLLSEEETELTNRIRKDGSGILYVPKAGVKHLVPNARLTRSWLRRRLMWQAVSDQIVGKPMHASVREQEHALMQYIGAVPARFRSLRAFFYDEDDPELFKWQVQALYTLYALTLGSGELFSERL